MTQIIKDRAKQAGVNVTPHSFRRGMAVDWLRKGGSETHLRQVCGWRSPRMIETYTQSLASEEALAQHARLFP
jgi:integrase